MDAKQLLAVELARAGLVTKTGRVNLRAAADRLGISYGTLQAWASGNRSPSADALDAALRSIGRQLAAVDLPVTTTETLLEGSNHAGSTAQH